MKKSDSKGFRAVLWLVLLLALLSVLAGCDRGGTADTTAVQTEAPAPESQDLVLLGEDAVCSVIRPDLAPDFVVKAAVALRAALTERTGLEPGIGSDFNLPGREADPDACEILFGVTNRPEGADALSRISAYSSYEVYVRENKLIVIAADETGYSLAVDALTGELSRYWSGETKTLAIPRDFSLSGQGRGDYASLPFCRVGSVETQYNCGDNTWMLILRQTTAEGFEAYLTDASALGYSLVQRSAIGKNLFATLADGRHTVSVTYTPSDGRTRLIIAGEREAALPDNAPTPFEKKHDVTTLTQVGLEFAYGDQDITKFQIGLLYIYRLQDGSFLILDGGPNRPQDLDRLMTTLKSLADDPKNIRVAAWILTHVHGDHTGAIRRLLDTASGSLTIEKLFYNFPCADVLASVDESRDTLDTSLRKSSAVVVKPHPGQIFHIRNAEVQFYYTHELLPPTPVSGGGNTFSMVFSITVDGQKTMFLGDESTVVSELLVRTYGSSLKSDMVQVAHHGATGGTVALYKLIDMKVALWPLGEWDYWYFGGHGRKNETWNAWLYESPNMEQILLAGHSTVTLNLPYVVPADAVRLPWRTVDENYQPITPRPD